jgi:hypothetical protein
MTETENNETQIPKIQWPTIIDTKESPNVIESVEIIGDLPILPEGTEMV